MRRAAGYIRVSKEKKDGLSPETQMEKIRQYCNLHEIELVKVYQDLDFTGRNDKRPQFQEMIADVRQSKYDVVLVYKLDRFARSSRDFHKYMSILDTTSCDLISISQNLDTSTPVGRLIRNILIDFAQFESEMISERVRDNLKQNARRGKRNGGNAPFGYRWDAEHAKLIPDPTTAPILKELFARYASGTGAPSLAVWLESLGISPSLGGKRWRHDSVLYILQNKCYVGINEYDGEEHPAVYEPLVEQDLFDRVQAVRMRQGEAHGFGREGLHLLAHLCRCGICGAPYNSRIQGPTKQRRLRCEGRRYSKLSCASHCVDAASLESKIVSAAFSLISEEGVLKELQRQYQSEAITNTGPLHFERSKLKREFDKLDKAIKEAFDDYYVHNVITKEQFSTFKTECEKKQRAVQMRIDEIGQSLEGIDVLRANLDMLWQSSADLQQSWQNLTLAEQREALRSVIKVVRIFPGHAEVDFGLFKQNIDVHNSRRGVAFY